MSYPKTNQTRSGHIHEVSANAKRQPGSTSNEKASNAATNDKFATSDHWPSATSAPKAKSKRAEGTGNIAPGYVPAGGPSPSPRKVGNTIKKVSN